MYLVSEDFVILDSVCYDGLRSVSGIPNPLF